MTKITPDVTPEVTPATKSTPTITITSTAPRPQKAGLSPKTISEQTAGKNALAKYRA